MAISPNRCNADSKGYELVQHGAAAFPIACYENDLSRILVPWHWHEELEAGIILEGNMTLAVGSERYTLHSGEGFFLNTSVLHSCWDEVSECKFLSLVFHPRLIGGSLDNLIHQIYMQPLLENQSLEYMLLTPEIPWQEESIAYIKQAWEMCAFEPYGFEIKVRNALSDFLLSISSTIHTSQKKPSEKALREEERLKTMLQFIHTNMAEEIKLEQIACSASISTSECIRCFHSTIGSTPIQYLRTYRIQRAAQLLADTEEKISLISEKCGFSDISYFTKTFREIIGCPPAEYRCRQNRGT